MRIVAGGAPFPDGLVLEDERSALRDMTLRAGIALTCEIKCTADDRLSFVRIMAIAATHFAMRHRMSMRQVKPPFHLQVALEADLGRAIGIDDRVPRAAAFIMQAAGPVTGLTPNIIRVYAVRFQTRVCGSSKILRDVRMTFRAGRRTHISRSRNFRRHDDHAIDSYARDQHADRNEEQQDRYSYPPARFR